MAMIGVDTEGAQDGRVFLQRGCDYTGWDCQS